MFIRNKLLFGSVWRLAPEDVTHGKCEDTVELERAPMCPGKPGGPAESSSTVMERTRESFSVESRTIQILV